jgi:hypothetical protein
MVTIIKQSCASRRGCARIGHERLFCHRNDIGPGRQKNARGTTVRQREAPASVDRPDLPGLAQRGGPEEGGEEARDAQRGLRVLIMKLRVQCYAGRKADERPVRFQLGECDYGVEEVIDQWYGPEDVFFKVRADDGNLYILRHKEARDEWSLESFRRL